MARILTTIRLDARLREGVELLAAAEGRSVFNTIEEGPPHRPDRRPKASRVACRRARCCGLYVYSRCCRRPQTVAVRCGQWTPSRASLRVVERTHSWLNRFRRILTRWEKRADTYLAMLHLACGLITWRATNWGHLPE